MSYVNPRPFLYGNWSFFTKLINVAATRARSYLAFMHFGPENDVWWAFNSLKKSKTIEI